MQRSICSIYHVDVDQSAPSISTHADNIVAGFLLFQLIKRMKRERCICKKMNDFTYDIAEDQAKGAGMAKYYSMRA